MYFEAKTVHVTARKRGNSHLAKISDKLIGMLNGLPRQSERVFSYKNVFYMGKSFRKQRRRIKHNLSNPRILGTHFHTLRHWRATMEYHKTKDILHVMHFLGRRRIENTLIYIQLEQMLFNEGDEYHCKTAATVEEASVLIEAGFEHVTDIDGIKLFRKRK